jgi:hypothetical protein
MKTIVTPVAELLAQLHDHAAGVAKLIEAIPALKGDDLPQIVNRVHMLGRAQPVRRLRARTKRAARALADGTSHKPHEVARMPAGDRVRRPP